jgi:hypothetical protein
VLTSGGTGITYVLSYFLDVLAQAREGKGTTRHLHLVWHIRHASHLSWITPILNEALGAVPLDMTVQIDLHLTKSSAGEDPNVTPITEIKVNAESPAGTSSSSLESPSSLIDEKKEVQEGQVCGEGLRPTASTYVRWKAGRADLVEIIREDVISAKGAMNVMGEWRVTLWADISVRSHPAYHRHAQCCQQGRESAQSAQGPADDRLLQRVFRLVRTGDGVRGAVRI